MALKTREPLDIGEGIGDDEVGRVTWYNIEYEFEE